MDSGFGTNGYTEINSATQNENLNGLKLLSNGKVIGVGYTHLGDPWYGEFAIMVKLNTNGSPDPGFGTNGVLIPSVYTNYSQAFDCSIVNDYVFISSFMEDASAYKRFALVKVDQNGNPDPGFGTGGISILSIDQLTYGEDIYYGGDNKFYIGGSSGQSGLTAPRDFFLARYNYDGSIDAGFNGNGYVKTSVGSAWDHAFALDMGPDGKIALVGFTAMGPTGDNDRALTRYLNDYVPPVFLADFTASSTTVCYGNTVNFTDLSQGTVGSWEWTFEGGTPATSSQQNPTVTYNTLGTFDVKLVISDGSQEDSLIMIDYITVLGDVGQADMPSGETGLCGSYYAEYTTGSVQYATSYEWVVSPSDAGSLTGSDTVAGFQSSDTWTGNYSIKVRAVNDCGDGAWSDKLQCVLWLDPTPYFLEGEGAYCTGEPGAELSLENSQQGVNYELFKDGSPTGNIIPGTGSSVSFGLISNDGLYTCSGYTANCQENMSGNVWVHEITAPAQPSMPTGPETVCDNDISTYSTELDPDVTDYNWTLTPPEAGTMQEVHDTVNITWIKGFIGNVLLSVQAANDCGDSPESEELSISVEESPEPFITGVQLACSDEEELYSTQENTGSTYLWDVSGGTITSGSGTHQIVVLWGDPGDGWIKVAEENSNGCITVTDEYPIAIDDCTGITEHEGDFIRIYPNPAPSEVYISLNTYNVGDIEVNIINASGNNIAKLRIDGKHSSINVNTSAYPNGLYYVRLISREKILGSGKFMIIH